jgi:hypothetical protein
MACAGDVHGVLGQVVQRRGPAFQQFTEADPPGYVGHARTSLSRGVSIFNKVSLLFGYPMPPAGSAPNAASRNRLRRATDLHRATTLRRVAATERVRTTWFSLSALNIGQPRHLCH